MGNIGATIKRFLGNKNTVTILAVLIGIIVLWYFYNYRVNQAITTVSIPYAVESIDTNKKIEEDNLSSKEITQSTIADSDIVTDAGFLTDKYICTGTSIPAGGFFYKSQVCDKEQIKNSIFDRIPKGYTLYPLAVDTKATYADSILPGDYIDLYMSTTDDDGRVIYGPLIESIEVLAARDSEGKDVFWDSEAGTTSTLLFAVPENYQRLLNVAELLGDIAITPVPRSSSYTANPGETAISSEQLCQFIMRQYAGAGDYEGSLCSNNTQTQ